MPYKYQLSEEAEEDIFDGYLWYEKQKTGLGEEFLEALDGAEQTIVSNPNTYQVRYKKKVRTFVVNRFPYLIFYVIDGKNIDVISVFNTKQHPKEWKDRVK